MLLTYGEETKQPWRPITALPLLEFSPALESWSDIYTGPTSCLVVQQTFSSFVFYPPSLSFCRSARLFTERSLLHIMSRHATYCWLATSLFWYSALTQLYKNVFEKWHTPPLKAQYIIFAARGRAFKINKGLVWWCRDWLWNHGSCCLHSRCKDYLMQSDRTRHKSCSWMS